MTKISTDKSVVNDLTNQFTDSLSEVTFLPEKSFSFSQSSSVSGTGYCPFTSKIKRSLK